ncbi:MAG: response regulator [Sinobacterium sp.]|nr:response regulator [Sinobacterium sp.]
MAEDGVQGLQSAQAEDFDLILTDINMPEMNGIELIGKLRELDAYKHKPILVLTTESSTEMKTKGKSAGATGWIVKPFEPEKLLSALERVLH